MNRKKLSRITYIAWVLESLVIMYYLIVVMGYGIFEVHMNPYAGLSGLNGVLLGLFIGLNLLNSRDK